MSKLRRGVRCFSCGNHGDSGRQGHPHHQGAVRLRNDPAVYPSASLSACAHRCRTLTKDTCAIQSNKNKLKWTCKHAQLSTIYTHKQSSAPDSCPLAPNTSPLPHSLSFAPFLLLTYCQVSTKQKKHILPWHQLIDYWWCQAKMTLHSNKWEEPKWLGQCIQCLSLGWSQSRHLYVKLNAFFFFIMLLSKSCSGCDWAPSGAV